MNTPKIVSIIENAKWKFAKTYATFSPHEYIVKGEHCSVEDYLFLAASILQHGHIEQFMNKQRKYLHIGNYKYWLMTDKIEESKVLNRASHGVYDLIADKYDEMFSDAKSKKEDEQLAIFLNNEIGIEGNVADIGCGTGLLLELTHIPPSNYCGIDPSQKMISKLLSKHPEYKPSVEVLNAEEWLKKSIKERTKFDRIFMLWGVMSYVKPEIVYGILKRLKPNGIFYGTAFDPYYIPEAYKRAKVAWSNIKATQFDVNQFTHVKSTPTHWGFTHVNRLY